jgi:hypothetical protein
VAGHHIRGKSTMSAFSYHKPSNPLFKGNYEQWLGRGYDIRSDDSCAAIRGSHGSSAVNRLHILRPRV